MAATEFRVGRIWPPGYMRVNYLWDQVRIPLFLRRIKTGNSFNFSSVFTLGF